MKVVDKRGVEQEPSESISESTGKADRITVPEAPNPQALDDAIVKPNIGERFYLHDVQFQIAAAVPEGLLIVPVGLSPKALKHMRRLYRDKSK